MKVLIACEFSGIVRDAFIALGHDAMSCDLLPTDLPGQHWQGNIIALLKGASDGYFDLIIAHPECTALSVSGNKHYSKGKPRHNERIKAAEWTRDLWELCKCKSKRVCLENPIGVLGSLTDMPKPSYVHPYEFGHMEKKKTALYLHNLEPLKDTNNVYDEMMLLPKNQRERIFYLPPSQDRWKIRSTTFTGLAMAMATQWG